MIGTSSIRVDLHLNLLVLALSVLVAVEGVMHVEEGDQWDQISKHEVDTLPKLEEAWVVTCQLLSFKHVDA